MQAAREFLDLVGYYHQFIPGFATIAALLTNLTRKGQPNQVNWGDNQEVSFQQLKYLVTGAPVMQVADPSSPTSSRWMPSIGALGLCSVSMIRWETSILLLSQVASSYPGRPSTRQLRRSASQSSGLCSFSMFTCMGSHSPFRLTTNLLPSCREQRTQTRGSPDGP